MKLEVIRFSSEKDSTSGILFDVTGNRKFLCYTLEDQYQTKKVMQETRIPAGEYEIKYRKEGGFHKDTLKGILIFIAVCFMLLTFLILSGFLYMLVILTSIQQDVSYLETHKKTIKSRQTGFIGKSSQAYVRVYDKIANALDMGEKVTITYYDFDIPDKKNK